MIRLVTGVHVSTKIHKSRTELQIDSTNTESADSDIADVITLLLAIHAKLQHPKLSVFTAAATLQHYMCAFSSGWRLGNQHSSYVIS